MLAEIYLLKLEAAVRAAKEAATTASTSSFCRSPYRLARRPNPQCTTVPWLYVTFPWVMLCAEAHASLEIARRYPCLKTDVRDRSFLQPTRTATPIHRLRPGGRTGGS